MSYPNPTGRIAVPLRTPERHRPFLLDLLSTCRRGVAADLADPDRLADPARTQREADAYDRLIAAVGTGSIVPDPDVQRVVEALLDAADDSNEYCRVVAEHAALVGLFDQVGGGRS